MSIPKELPLKADPWLLWHELIGSKRGGRSLMNPPNRLWVLAEREDSSGWPSGLIIAERYLKAGSRIATGWIDPVASDLSRIRDKVKRLKVTRPVRPQLAASKLALGWTAAKPIDPGAGGKGVVIGFVDNGCAFAHPHFCRDGTTRVERLWDQTERLSPSTEWLVPPDFRYGWEICRENLPPFTPEASGANNSIYEKLNYRLQEAIDGRYREGHFTHGTHIMDIAAGCGAVPGMAPEASIIFVQLPAFSITESTEQASARHILDGISYIFDHAGDRPAVVNISYNSFAGPHDGTSLLEQGLDELLDKPDRAVVISAGNGGNTRCHAADTVERDQLVDLRWEVKPNDQTENFIEIWYPQSGQLHVSIMPPRVGNFGAAVGPNRYLELQGENERTIGLVVHRAKDSGTLKNQILIALNPSTEGEGAPSIPGIWTIRLRNTGEEKTQFDAWIERDDRGRNPLVEQTRFIEGDAKSASTLGGFCTGKRTIVVGAYSAATSKVLPFSSLGPSLNDAAPARPDVYAPGASDLFGEGVLAAAARSALPVRLAGTSMAAPFVAGLIALLFEKASASGRKLSTEDVRRILLQSARPLSESDVRKRIDPKAALDLLQLELNAMNLP